MAPVTDPAASVPLKQITVATPPRTPPSTAPRSTVRGTQRAVGYRFQAQEGGVLPLHATTGRNGDATLALQKSPGELDQPDTPATDRAQTFRPLLSFTAHAGVTPRHRRECRKSGTSRLRPRSGSFNCWPCVDHRAGSAFALQWIDALVMLHLNPLEPRRPHLPDPRFRTLTQLGTSAALHAT